MNRLNRSLAETIPIKTPGSTRIVFVHNILYAERVSRFIRYNLSDNTVIDSMTFNGTFRSAVSPLLSRHEFLLVGSSFAVNLYHVTEVTQSEMLLNETHCVPIPRHAYQTVKSAWADYWLKKGDTHVFEDNALYAVIKVLLIVVGTLGMMGSTTEFKHRPKQIVSIFSLYLLYVAASSAAIIVF